MLVLATLPTTSSRAATITSTASRKVYFNIDTFEYRFHFTDGHQEDNCLNDGQGVYETPGAYLEASTTYRWKKVWSELGIKAYHEVTAPTTCPW